MMIFIYRRINIIHYIACLCACGHRISILRTPAQSQIDVEPLSIIGSKHFHQQVINEHSFTERPGEGGQEEVVQQGCHKLAGYLYTMR